MKKGLLEKKTKLAQRDKGRRIQNFSNIATELRKWTVYPYYFSDALATVSTVGKITTNFIIH